MNDLLEKLNSAVDLFTRNDPHVGGVLTSASALEKGMTEAFVIRYRDLNPNLGETVCQVSAPTLDDAIVHLSKKFVEYLYEEECSDNPIDVLKKAIIYL